MWNTGRVVPLQRVQGKARDRRLRIAVSAPAGPNIAELHNVLVVLVL